MIDDFSIDEILHIINTHYSDWIIWYVPQFDSKGIVIWIPNLMNKKSLIAETLDSQDSIYEALLKSFYWIKYYEESKLEENEHEEDY